MTMSAAEMKSARASLSRRMALGLGLAASPVFALMAWDTAMDPYASGLCSPRPGWLSMNDMAAMYLLMSLFHLPSWLRLPAFGRTTHD